MHIFLDEDLGIAINILASHYTRKESILLEYDWPTCCVMHYTPLTMFCYKEEYTTSDATAVARMLTSTGTMTHRQHCTIHGNITENINDLFAPFEEEFSYVILIEGIAGIGKSTLCKEIALKWANKNILKNKDLLFLLFMHDPKIKNITNIESLVKNFFQSEILASKITEWLIVTDGKYLTIIINGYNEVCESSFITHFIVNRKILTQCSLIITSRSPASSHLSRIVNQRVLVIGFTKNNQITFIDNALKGLNSKIKYLKDYLQSNSLIDNLCNIPLIMNLLLHFVEDYEEGISNIQRTQTSLIQKYLMIITKKNNISYLSDLPHPYDQVIKDLSQFAFIAVQEDQLTFTVGEILELCNNNFQVYWHRLGILNKIYKLGLLNKISFPAKGDCYEIFNFNHLTIQEYLAAYYLSSLPDSELLKLLHGTFWTIRYFNVWIMYVGITEGNSSVFKDFLSSQLFGDSQISLRTPSNKIDFCLNQLHCLKEANGNLNDTLLGQDIDLKHQKLSHNHLHTLVALLSRSLNKQWKNFDLSDCGIDSQGCTILHEMFDLSTELNFETVDVSYNNFHLKSFCTICSALHTKKLVFSIDTLYDTAIMNVINDFTAMLEELFLNNVHSDEILLLTYLAKQSKLIAVYSTPTHIRWFQWTDRKLNKDTIKEIKDYVENKVRSKNFKIAFSYTIIDYHTNTKNLSSLLSDIQNIQVCGSYLHSKGAYLLNVPSTVTIDCQYNSPQELMADYFAAVLCHNIQSTTPYLESLSPACATVVQSSLQNALSMRVFDISDNSINSQIANEIAIVLSLTSSDTLQAFCASNNLLAENSIKIAKALQNCSNLRIFNMSNNNICENAVHDIAKVLFHNKLHKLYLNNNSFKTAGMIKIAKALKNTSNLTVFNISHNSIGKGAADDIATVLSHNTKLNEIYLNNNKFTTVGMIKIAKVLHHVSTLISFNISNNNVGEQAADDIATALSHNTKLKEIYLNNNKFKTVGTIKIAKVLHHVSTLISFNISNNNIGEQAADDVATILSHNAKMQRLHLSNNSFKTGGIIKIAKALKYISTLTEFYISNNGIGEEAANDIAVVLSHNSKMQRLHLSNNSFKTAGMIKIAKALQNVSTLTALRISDNSIGEEAVDNIIMVLSHNIKLKEIYLNNNKFETAGMVKIAKALQNISTLTCFNISNNDVGEEAADDIATVLLCNTQLQKVYLHNNNFETAGAIKITNALSNISTLAKYNI